MFSTLFVVASLYSNKSAKNLSAHSLAESCDFVCCQVLFYDKLGPLHCPSNADLLDQNSKHECSSNKRMNRWIIQTGHVFCDQELLLPILIYWTTDATKLSSIFEEILDSQTNPLNRWLIHELLLSVCLRIILFVVCSNPHVDVFDMQINTLTHKTFVFHEAVVLTFISLKLHIILCCMSCHWCGVAFTFCV